MNTQKRFPARFVNIIVNYVDSEADNEMEILIDPHSLQKTDYIISDPTNYTIGSK